MKLIRSLTVLLGGLLCAGASHPFYLAPSLVSLMAIHSSCNSRAARFGSALGIDAPEHKQPGGRESAAR